MADNKPSLTVQIGGSHYTECAIQPVEFIEANKLGFLEGCVVKRLCRHDKKTGKGRQDIEKAIHELQLLLEHRYPIGDAGALTIRSHTHTEIRPAHANDNTPCCSGGVQSKGRCGGCLEGDHQHG